MGLADHAAVVAWADAAILKLDRPPEALTTLALTSASESKASVGLLGQLAAGADQDLANRQVLTVLRHSLDRGTIDTDNAVRALNTYINFGGPPAEQRYDIPALDDVAYLQPDLLRDFIDKLLKTYADHSFDATTLLTS